MAQSRVTGPRRARRGAGTRTREPQAQPGGGRGRGGGGAPAAHSPSFNLCPISHARHAGAWDNWNQLIGTTA
eukprot:545758-Prymnesium_polylepis.2